MVFCFRFLLCAEAQALNNNDHLKRVLAAEKLESEVHLAVALPTSRTEETSCQPTSVSSQPSGLWGLVYCLGSNRVGVDTDDLEPEGNPPLKICSSSSLIVL